MKTLSRQIFFIGSIADVRNGDAVVVDAYVANNQRKRFRFNVGEGSEKLKIRALAPAVGYLRTVAELEYYLSGMAVQQLRIYRKKPSPKCSTYQELESTGCTVIYSTIDKKACNEYDAKLLEMGDMCPRATVRVIGKENNVVLESHLFSTVREAIAWYEALNYIDSEFSAYVGAVDLETFKFTAFAQIK